MRNVILKTAPNGTDLHAICPECQTVLMHNLPNARAALSRISELSQHICVPKLEFAVAS